MGNINEPSGEVTGVCGTECGIGKTLTSTMGADEEFEHVQALAEVRTDRNLDDLTSRVRHKTAHTCELTDLVGRTAGSGICHHEDGVDGAELVHQGIGDLGFGILPNLDDLIAPILP